VGKKNTNRGGVGKELKFWRKKEGKKTVDEGSGKPWNSI